MLLSASALQLMPDLRGQWMFDPLNQRVEFVEFGLLRQWLQGGGLAALLMAAAVPVLGQLYFLQRAGRLVASAADRAAVVRFQQQVGAVDLPHPLVVRKRRRGADTVDAAAVRVAAAGGLRRAIARSIDQVAVVLAATSGVIFGILFIGWQPEEAPPLGGPAAFGGALLVGLYVMQWAGLRRHGQSFGKALLGIRVEPGSDSPRHFWLLRDVLWDVGVMATAALVATATPPRVLGWLAERQLAERLREDWAGPILALVVWVVALVALDLLRGVPLALGSHQALHDRPARTRVVRTAIGPAIEPPPPALAARVCARLLDEALVAAPAVALLGIAAALSDVTRPLWLGLIGMTWLGARGASWAGLARYATTPGKRLLGLAVVGEDGQPASAAQLVLHRELLGMFFPAVVLPAMVTAALALPVLLAPDGSLTGQLLVWIVSGVAWLAALALVGLGASLGALGDAGRTHADWAAGTRVVPAR